MELAAFLFFTLVFAGLAFISCAMAMEAKLADPAIPQPQAVHAILQSTPEETLIIETTATPETATEAPEPEILYDVPLDDGLQRYIREECEVQGVPFEIALALIQKESSCRESVISKTGDYGLMQVNECNHEWLSEELGITDILDPEQNVRAGIYILGQAFQKYDDPHQALMAYNMGDAGMREVWEQGQHSSAYSRSVLEIAEELQRKEVD